MSKKNDTQQENRRKHKRLEMILSAELHLPNQERPLAVRVRDISLGGVFTVLEPNRLPPEGSIIKVRLKTLDKFGYDSPVIEMKVVRIRGDGIGLMYLD